MCCTRLIWVNFSYYQTIQHCLQNYITSSSIAICGGYDLTWPQINYPMSLWVKNWICVLQLSFTRHMKHYDINDHITRRFHSVSRNMDYKLWVYHSYLYRLAAIKTARHRRCAQWYKPIAYLSPTWQQYLHMYFPYKYIFTFKISTSMMKKVNTDEKRNNDTTHKSQCMILVYHICWLMCRVVQTSELV